MTMPAPTGTNLVIVCKCQRCRLKRAFATLPAGSAGKLQLQLIDTATNTGSVEPLATASVDLDMRQWKDSQTYQAEVPLMADGVQALLLNDNVQIVHACQVFTSMSSSLL